MRRLHHEYGKADQGYTGVVLQVARPDDVPSVAAAVRRMGYGVDEGERALAERVGLAIAVTAGALAVLALLMTALAALAIAQSLSASIRARTREIAILEALGATAGDVRALVLAEAGLVGLAGGAVGVLVARLAALGADRAALRWLPDFPFRPETFFSFPAWLLALGVGVSVAAAVVGALAPAAIRGSRRPGSRRLLKRLAGRRGGGASPPGDPADTRRLNVPDSLLAARNTPDIEVAHPGGENPVGTGGVSLEPIAVAVHDESVLVDAERPIAREEGCASGRRGGPEDEEARADDSRGRAGPASPRASPGRRD